MDKKIHKLMNLICREFEEYNFLKTDLYKGKIIGGYNIYYKKGDNNTEGFILGKRDYKRFKLNKFPYNFVTYGSFNGSIEERGWAGETAIEVLNHIKKCIDEETN